MKNLVVFLVIISILTNCGRNAKGCFKYEQTAPLTITFDASCSQKAYFYHWRFDDGDSLFLDMTTTSPFLTHTYKKAGTYYMVLIVGDKKDRTKRIIGGVPKKSMSIEVR